MRGDQSPPAQGIHSLRAPPTNRVRSRTLLSPPHLPTNPKTSLYGNRRPKNEKSFCPQPGGCRAGKFGEMREVWRGKDTLRKGVLPPPRSFLSLIPIFPARTECRRVFRGRRRASRAPRPQPPQREQNFFRFSDGGCRTGKFLADWEVRGFCRVRLRARFIGDRCFTTHSPETTRFHFWWMCLMEGALCRGVIRRERPACRSAPINN